jgi:hypothetical protein
MFDTDRRVIVHEPHGLCSEDRIPYSTRAASFVVHRIVCENLPTPESGHWPVARMRHAALDFSTDAIHSPLARIVNGSVRESLTRGGL